MTAALNLLAPDQASKLLEEIIYERVLACIDVDALLTFECELSTAFDECGFDSDVDAPDRAKEMIDRALHRLRDQRWQAHLRGDRTCELVPWDCELCAEALPPATPARRTSS